MTRPARPLPELPISPAYVSQLSSLCVLGVDPRRFLEVLVPMCRGHVASIGRLRLVPVAIAAARLAALAERQALAGAPITPAVEDADLESVEAVLAAVGRRLRPGAGA